MFQGVVPSDTGAQEGAGDEEVRFIPHVHNGQVWLLGTCSIFLTAYAKVTSAEI